MVHLESDVWQQVPGTHSTWIYPLIRKPSITGSNSFIIRSQNHLMVIDPGAISEQMEKIKEVLGSIITSPDHPVIIIAGHIHMDHMYLGMVDRQLQSMARIIYAAEAWGAKQLENASPLWTGADVVGLPITGIPVEVKFFAHEQSFSGTTRTITVSGCPDIVLTAHEYKKNGHVFRGESMALSDEDRIEFWHTPGHSQDSLTIKIGSFVHIGDIPFSTNPGIAGRPGWSRDELLRSVQNINEYLLADDETICCPGHGRANDKKTTQVIFKKIEDDLIQMPEIAEFNQERLNLSMWHGLDLAEEAHRIYPVITGRLLSLSYYLEMLEMNDEAMELNQILQHDKIDEFLDDFNSFYNEFREGKKCVPEVVLKALQIFEKIQSTFPTDDLKQVIDDSLIRRATRLTSDLLSTIQGTIPKGTLQPTSILPLIEEYCETRSSAGTDEQNFLNLADDEIAYRRAMVTRIAHHLHDCKLPITLHAPGITPDIQVPIDKARFIDFLSGITEYVKKISAQSMGIIITTDCDEVQITFIPHGQNIDYTIPIPGATLREITYAGGEMISVMHSGKEDIRIRLPITHTS